MADLEQALAGVARSLERDAGAVAAAWRGDAAAVSSLGDAGRDVDHLGVELAARCQSRQGAAALREQLSDAGISVALHWAATQAARHDLVLAPLCESRSARHAALLAEAASARLATGPLHDAVACAPRVFTSHRLVGALRVRFDALVWELAARGESDGPLAAWLAADADALAQLVLERARGSFAQRLRAANLLSVAADGIGEWMGLGTTHALARAAEDWLACPEPALWRVAARALGRLAWKTDAARRVLRAWAARRPRWQRRRIAAAIAATPPGSGSWIERELERALGSDDAFLVAALAVAGPHLARERPEVWERLLDRATEVPENGAGELTADVLAIAWSVAQGLEMLARHQGPRALTLSERAAAESLQQRLAGRAAGSTVEASRAFTASIRLAAIAGDAPPADLVFETADHAIRCAAAGRAAPPLADPGSTIEAALAQLGAPDETVRGRAHVVLRSATRAYAARIDELAAALVNRGAQAAPEARTTRAGALARLPDEIRGRLAAEVCEYGLRTTLVECAGDLVDAAPAGPPRGREAARMLRAVIESAWVRERGTRDREVRSFRKPLEDLLRRCAGSPLPTSLFAWWLLAGGSAATLTALDLDELTPDAARALVLLEGALRDAALGASVDRWGERASAALLALRAADTAQATAIARVIAALEITAQGAATRADAETALGELVAAVELYRSVAVDLELAVTGGFATPGGGDTAESATGQLRVARGAREVPHAPAPHDVSRALSRWDDDLAAPVRDVVLPLARGLADLVARHAEPARMPGTRIAGFELIERLGGGGFGEVWKARRDGQFVALKLPLAGARPAERAELAGALVAEAGHLAGVSTAKVVTMIDRGIEDGMPYLATCYLRGRTWAEHALTGTRMALPLALRIAAEACIGLANLHEMGIVHRDVTPRNIFLRFRGADPSPIPDLAADPHGRRIDEVVLIDLGIAQRIGDPASTHISFGYVAPEILDGSPVGPAADVYGLGASLFHVLTGVGFSDGMSRAQALAWHLDTSPFDDPRIVAAARDLPPEIAELLAAATSRDARQRATLEHIESEFQKLGRRSS